MKWEKVKLGDVAVITSSKRIFAEQYTDKGVKFYRQKEIIDKKNKIDVINPIYISKDVYENIKEKFGVPKKGDLLITAVGVTLGIPYVVDEEEFYFKDGNLIWLRNFTNKVYSKYLYYWISSESGQKSMWARTIGSAQPALTIDIVKQLEINVPDYKFQQRVASILSAYDDLIENNQKQIKLLEEAAQRLYKEWFVDLRFPGHEDVEIVDGLPNGWKKASMDSIAEYLNGFAFKPDDWGEKGKPIIKIKEMTEGVSISTPRNDGNNVPEKYNIKRGDILFSWSATLTAMIWDDEEGLLNQHLFKVTPNDKISREFMLQSILFTLEEFKNLTTGSTMKHIQRGKLKEVYINMPTDDVMYQFVVDVEPLREKILGLKRKILLLKEARDRLLPKLMSGEVEV